MCKMYVYISDKHFKLEYFGNKIIDECSEIWFNISVLKMIWHENVQAYRRNIVTIKSLSYKENTQQTYTCSKLTTETLEKDVKYVQS